MFLIFIDSQDKILDYHDYNLSEVRSSYFNKEIDLENALSYYIDWVNTPLYAIFYRLNKKQYGYYQQGRDWYSCDYKAVELAKRGNRVYIRKLAKRFKELFNLLDLIPENDILKGRVTTSNMFMVTLTYDKNRCSLDDAYFNIGKELNQYLSSLKQKYGKIKILRSIESFKNGYPHIHLFIIFLEHRFNVFRYNRKKDGKVRYKLSNVDKNNFDSYWHSYTHNEAVMSIGGVYYILKYITKGQFTKDNNNSTAHLWLFHKQSYSISREFVDILGKNFDFSPLLVTSMSNSNNSLIGWHYLISLIPKKKHDSLFFEILEPPPFDERHLESTLEEIFREVI